MKFIPCHTHSHFSILDGMSKPNQMVSRCVDLGYKSCALTDHGSVSGCVEFHKECKKKEIKSIFGIELYISSGLATDQSKESKNLHQIILAKNLIGWKKLIKLVSRSNNPDIFYYKPRVDYNILGEICDNNFISFSGHPSSTLYELVRLEQNSYEYIKKMWDIFGKENFFIEIQLLDERQEVKKIVKKLRELATYYGIKTIATFDSHYVYSDQSDNHKVLLCSSLQTTLKNVMESIENEQKTGLDGFFKSNRFHIPTPEEMLEYGNTPEEIENTCIIDERCENYSILSPPKLPRFQCGSEKDLLLELCLKGWQSKSKRDWDKQIYGDRIKHELKVINDANLEGYFLIVQDFINHAKNKGILVGPARGSAAGSLVAYLLNITNIDPIKHDLIFERFYNSGRNTKDRVSLPDIDVDVPLTYRNEIIEYIKGKYGENCVAQMATFGKLMGRGALKEVLRIHSACDFQTMNNISSCLPHEHEIADKLEETGEESIISYVLKHDPDLIKDYCHGNYEGDYGKYFKQASELEGTIKSQGKHAAGLIIANSDLNEICPMIRSKDGIKVTGFDMYSSEDIGLVKFDILSVVALDKLMNVNNLLGGRNE